jgi:hypothetical protein
LSVLINCGTLRQWDFFSPKEKLAIEPWKEDGKYLNITR